MSIFSSTLIFGLTSLASTGQFKHKTIENRLLYNETQINYIIDSKNIGLICYTKIPALNVYILHNFYVYPQYRNKGHGKQLLQYTCNYLDSIGANKTYIQPGPFEIADGHNKNIRGLDIKNLVKLYAKFDFVFTNKALSKLAYIAYKIIGLNENSNYLMVRENKENS